MGLFYVTSLDAHGARFGCRGCNFSFSGGNWKALVDRLRRDVITIERQPGENTCTYFPEIFAAAVKENTIEIDATPLHTLARCRARAAKKKLKKNSAASGCKMCEAQ